MLLSSHKEKHSYMSQYTIEQLWSSRKKKLFFSVLIYKAIILLSLNKLLSEPTNFFVPTGFVEQLSI